MKVATLVLVSASVALGATVSQDLESEDASLQSLQTSNALETSPQLQRIIRKGHSLAPQGRSFIENMQSRVMSFFGYDNTDDYSDFYSEGGDDSYYPDGNVGGQGSSYGFYQPYNQYGGGEFERQDNFEDEDSAYGWGDFMLDAAVVAVPMALVLAAMPTGLFTIPIVGRSMQNSLVDNLREIELPVFRAVEGADLLSYTTRDCQERLFCEISKVGESKDASILQKMFYIAANMTPDQYAESYGLSKLFKASRSAKCEQFKCVPLMSSGGVFSKKQRKVVKTL